MKKLDELNHPNSCLNKATPNELIFVLLGRDPAVPGTIDAWVAERLSLQKNQITDSQIQEAKSLANQMREEQRARARCKRGIHSINTSVSNTTCIYCDVDLTSFYKKT